jgi:hypothetical protein
MALADAKCRTFLTAANTLTPTGDPIYGDDVKVVAFLRVPSYSVFVMKVHLAQSG